MYSFKEKAVNGIFWSSIDTFAGQGAAFVIGIVLARLLTPSDYGMIGMLAIFMALAQMFINSGFGAALIQKTDRTDADYSTVFFFNFATAIVLYLLLFGASGAIAGFFKTPALEPIAKVLALNFVIGALSFVHRTKLSIELNFRLQTKISIVSIVISGCAGILSAYKGMGVWSLVVQSLVNALCQSALYWMLVTWKPVFLFSNASFRQLFRFGSKLLASGLLDTTYKNLNSVVIGRAFSASDLGYYTRGQQLALLPAQSLTEVLGRVTFPIFCTMQDDQPRLIAAYRKMIRLTSFITIPLMILLASVAAPLVVLLFTEKWADSSLYFQILCFAGIWYPMHVLNLNILQAIGRSDLFFRLEVIKKILGVIILAVTIPLGLTAIVLGQAFTSFVCLFINAYYTGKYFGYGIARQLRDVSLFLFVSLVLYGMNLAARSAFDSNAMKVTVGVSLYAGLYLAIAAMLKLEEVNEVASMIKNIFLRPAAQPR